MREDGEGVRRETEANEEGLEDSNSGWGGG